LPHLLVEHFDAFFGRCTAGFGLDEAVKQIFDLLVLLIVPSSKSAFFLGPFFENALPFAFDVDLLLCG
jgi:hypothetical protein